MSRRRQRGQRGQKGGEQTAFPQKPWYQTTTALIALVASLVAIISGAVAVYNANPWKAPPEERFNAEIVIDSSAAFQTQLAASGQTKLDALRQALPSVLGSVGTHDQLALRSFGGPCGGDNTRRLVDFTERNPNPIIDAVGHLQVGGELTLVHGIVEATSDLGKLGAPSSTVHNRIIVVTGGGADACDSDALTTISDRLGSARVPAEFRYIGMGVDPGERDQLNALAHATNRAQAGTASVPSGSREPGTVLYSTTPQAPEVQYVEDVDALTTAMKANLQPPSKQSGQNRIASPQPPAPKGQPSSSPNGPEPGPAGSAAPPTPEPAGSPVKPRLSPPTSGGLPSR